MYILPEDSYEKFTSCSEKIISYLTLAKLDFPILKSVIIKNQEIRTITENEINKIKLYLNNNKCIIRYIYLFPQRKPKNGGKMIILSKENLLKEIETNADLWLLEPVARENNLYAFNIFFNLELQNIHIEILGQGFDVSDINKGKINPHEYIDIPYPICFGNYNEWWKWASFHFCTQKEYENSIVLRKERLKEFQANYKIKFSSYYQPINLTLLEDIIHLILKIEYTSKMNNLNFFNLSCSYIKNKKIICWDIQTANGKYQAYYGN